MQRFLFRGAMVDVLTEDQKRRILTDCGEMQRWEGLAISARRAEKRTDRAYGDD